MKTKFKSFGNIHTIWGILLAMLLVQTASATLFTNEFWISPVAQTNFTNGIYGSGNLDCPFDGSTQAKFDGVMHYLSDDSSPFHHATIHLLAGTYQTLGDPGRWPGLAWRLQDGQKLLGSGIDNTIIQIATNEPSYGYVVSSYPMNCSHIEVADLTLDANYTPALGAVSRGGLVLCGTSLVARRVKVINFAWADPNNEVVGITFVGNGANSEGNMVEGCEIYLAPGYDGSGIAFNGGPDCWTSGIMRNNRVIGTGIGMGCGGAWMRNTLIEGNYFKGIVECYRTDTGGNTNIMVSHNVFEDCAYPVMLAGGSSQNLTFCFNTIILPSAGGAAFRFDSSGSYTNIVIIGNNVGYDHPWQTNCGGYFLWANNITGLVAANNTVDANLSSPFSGSTGVNMYFNYDLKGNPRTDLDTMGFSTMTSFGKSFLASSSSNAALVSLGLPWNPAVIMTNNQSQPVTFNTNVTVNGTLNYSNMVAQLLAGTGVTTSTLNTPTGRVVTVNANSQTNGFGNIVTHGAGEFASSTNATIWNSLSVTNTAATNWAALNVTPSNAVISVRGISVATLQTNGVLNAYNGLSTTVSNRTAAVSLYSGSGAFNWTNTLPENVAVYIDGAFGGVTYNGGSIFSSSILVRQGTILMQPGSIIQIGSGGSYNVHWHPF